MHIRHGKKYVSHGLALVSYPDEWPSDLSNPRKTGLGMPWTCDNGRFVSHLNGTHMYWTVAAKSNIVTFTEDPDLATTFTLTNTTATSPPPTPPSPARAGLLSVRIKPPPPPAPARLPRARAELGLAVVFGLGVPFALPSFFVYAEHAALDIQYGIRGPNISVCVLRLWRLRVCIDLFPFPAIALFLALMEPGLEHWSASRRQDIM